MLHIYVIFFKHVAIKSLIERNQENKKDEIDLNVWEKNVKKINNPIVVINTDSKTVIDCSISADRYNKEAFFICIKIFSNKKSF